MMARYALAFLAVFYVFYGAASVLAGFNPQRLAVGMAWEANIPFVPQAAWVYNSMLLLLIAVMVVLRYEPRIRGLFWVLCAQVVFASLVFVLLPIDKSFPLRDSATALPWVFVLADTLNLENNDLPSLHVCLAYTGAMIAGVHSQPLMRVGFMLWASAIAVSTLLMHEHHVLDLLTGWLLALAGYRYYRRRYRLLRGA